MIELGRVRQLLRILGEPANSMQECDRKRVAILELGNLGDESAVHPLLDFVDQDIFAISAIHAISKLKFVNSSEKELLNVVDKLGNKAENGSAYESVNAIEALRKIAEQRIESAVIVDRIIDALQKKGDNNLQLRNGVIEAIRRKKDVKEFHKPSQDKRLQAKAKRRAG